MQRRSFVACLSAFAWSGLTPTGVLAQARDLRGKSVTVEDVARTLFLEPGTGTPQPGGTAIIVDITFDLNSARIRADGARALDAVAEAARRPENAGRRISLEGHTDTSGPFAYNVDLSRRRAEAVRDYLIARGVEPYRLLVSGFGPSRLLSGLAPTDPRHRRVEIVNLG